MSKYFFCSLFFAFVFGFGVQFAQNFSVKNYSVENGLPTQNVFGAAQDSKGKMWFATRVGVSVYDGLTWKNFGRDENLQKESYYRIKIDSSGIVWASPQYLANPVVYYRNNSWHSIPKIPFREASQLWGNSFEIFYNNGSPVICVGTTNGLFYYSENTWHKLSIKDGLDDNYIVSIYAKQTKLFIVTSKGLFLFDGQKLDKSLYKLIPPKRKGIIAVTYSNEGNGKELMWILGKTWIGYIENSQFKLFTNTINLRQVQNTGSIMFEAGGKDRLYFGNNFAKFFINRATLKVYPLLQSNGFASNSATSIFVDREENVWFTDVRGIDKMNNFAFKNYYEFSGLQSSEVSSFVERNGGSYVLGHNYGLTIVEHGIYRRIDFPTLANGLFTRQRVLDMNKDSFGNIWIAASELGIGKLDSEGKIDWIKAPPGEIMTSVLPDRQGTIWAASNFNLYKVTENKLVKVRLKYPEYLGIRKIFSFNDGVLYFAATSGVYSYSNGIFKNLLNSSNSTPVSRNVFAILKVKKNEFLIGSEDGLNSFKEGKYTKVEKENLSNTIPVFALTKDKDNNVFVGSNDGFYKLEATGKIKGYSLLNGLAGREVNRSAFKFDSYNNLWIGTDRGLSCFSEEGEKLQVPFPVIDLKNIELIDGTVLPLTSNLLLSNNQNTFFINFCAISFIDENSIEYRLQLEGFDKQWFEISQSQLGKIRYTNLPYGEYRLSVMARNQRGDWSKPVYSGIITIDKAFYYKWWFIILSSVIELLILFGIYKIVVLGANNINLEKQVDIKTAKLRDSEQQLRAAFDELEKRVEERTDELAKANFRLLKYADEQKELNAYKDKFFSIVAHDLKSPFQGLLGITSILNEEFDNLTNEQVKHFLDVMKGATRNVYNLIDNLLEWSRLQTGKFPFTPEILNLYEETLYVKNLLELNLASKKIVMTVNISEDVFIFADKKMLHAILRNLSSNAIKFTNEGGAISISAKENNSFAEISVSDTGVGISPEDLESLFRIDKQLSTRGTNDEEGTGLGLSICKEMILKHNGTIHAESEINKGSKFIFTLPLS